MFRFRRSAAVFLVVFGVPAASAWAQFGYPAGYGAYGWGGWGGGGETVQGSIARGMGVMAAGMGQYNEQTAVARSINADTAMRWNQYMWQSQQEANRRQYARMAQRQQRVVATAESNQARLRDNPTPNDINRGDALNVALDEITNPKVYLRGLKGARTKLASTVIRDIPFQYAQAAITTSVEQLTKGGPPAALKTEAFAEERNELKAVGAEIRRRNEEGEKLDSALLEKGRAVLGRMRTKVESTIPANTPQRRAAENYIKALYGLSKMLETPAVDVLLAGVEKRPDTTLGDLIGFMTAFNLRFGVANTPRQQAAYRQLFPLLDGLRDEAAAGLAGATPGQVEGTQATEFFSGMNYEHVAPKPPAPGPANPQ